MITYYSPWWTSDIPFLKSLFSKLYSWDEIVLLTRVCGRFWDKWSSDCLATARGTQQPVAKKLSLAIASRFEIIDEEYVEELKGKIEKASSIRRSLQKVGDWKKLLSQFRRVRERSSTQRCPSIFMLSEKFSNFALLFVLTSNRVGASKLWINKTFLFGGCKLRLKQFQQLLKTQVVLILNFTPPHAIIFTKCTTYLLCTFFAFSYNLWTKSTF